MFGFENLKNILNSFKEIPKLFNNITFPGRANVAKVTYISLALALVAYQLTRKPKGDTVYNMLDEEDILRQRDEDKKKDELERSLKFLHGAGLTE